jgi:hypothetical protein
MTVLVIVFTILAVVDIAATRWAYQRIEDGLYQ